MMGTDPTGLMQVDGVYAPFGIWGIGDREIGELLGSGYGTYQMLPYSPSGTTPGWTGLFSDIWTGITKLLGINGSDGIVGPMTVQMYNNAGKLSNNFADQSQGSVFPQAGDSVSKPMWVTAYGPPQFQAGDPTSSGRPVGSESVASWRIPSPEFPGVGTATGSGTTYYPYGASVTVYDSNGNVIFTGIVSDKGPGIPWSASNQQLIQRGVRPESWIDIWQANPSKWATGWYGVTISWRKK
jgi:hypothetical protein